MKPIPPRQKLSLTPEIYSYKGGGSKDYSSPLINSYLRGNKLDPELERRATTLSSRLQPLTEEMTLYRGTGLEEFCGMAIQVGTEYTCRGFTSTSTSLTVVKKFQKGIILTITLTPGVKIFNLDPRRYIMKSSREYEVLVDKDTTFTITEIDSSLRPTKLKVTARVATTPHRRR